MRNKKIIFDLSSIPSLIWSFAWYGWALSPLTSFGFKGSKYAARSKQYIFLNSFCKHVLFLIMSPKSKGENKQNDFNCLGGMARRYYKGCFNGELELAYLCLYIEFWDIFLGFHVHVYSFTNNLIFNQLCKKSLGACSHYKRIILNIETQLLDFWNNSIMCAVTFLTKS